MKIYQVIGLLAALVLAGCDATLEKRPSLHQEIATEMQRAATSKDTLKQILPPLKMEIETAPRKVPEPRFDLVMNNAPAQQVFMALVSGTPYSMMMDPDLSGTISVNLKNVTVPEVLKALRETYHYDYELDGKIVRVHSNTMQTRIFQVNYLAAQRLGNSNLRVAASSLNTPVAAPAGASSAAGSPTTPPAGAPTSAAAATTSDNSRVSMRSDTDIWRDLEAAMGAIVGKAEGRSYVVNAHSGVILVRAMPDELRKVESFLRSTQLMIDRQVMLEAKIIDVTLSDESQAGINWASFYGNHSVRRTLGIVEPASTIRPVGAAGGLQTPSVSVTPGKGGVVAPVDIGKGFLGMAFQTANFSAVLNFLESQGAAQVLSSPRIATLNNQKAVLKVGIDDFFVTNVKANVTTNSSGGSVVTPEVTLASFFSGIALDVTPQVNDSGIVTLHIHPTVSTVTEKQKQLDLGAVMGQLTLPLASSNTSETDSMVRVRDGHIVAIGGLMRSESNDDRLGLPGTLDSGLGLLLGQRGSKKGKRELVILIRPTIVNTTDDWQADLTDTQARLEQYAQPRKPQP